MRIAEAHLVAIFQHVSTSSAEVCGVLIGRRTPYIEVDHVVTGHNIHPQPERHFLLDAASLLRADTIANAHQQAIIGFYHSHPNGTAFPSAYDRRDAWLDSIMMIVASSSMQPRYCCSWLLHDNLLIPEPIQIV